MPTPTSTTTARATPMGAGALTGLTTESAIWTTATSDWAGLIPPCGMPVTSHYPTDPTATPAPNACLFGGGLPTPFCHIPDLIVSDAATQTLPSTWPEPSGGPAEGFIYEGDDGYLCIGEDGDGEIIASHGDGGIVVQPNNDPIVYAARVDMQRSSGVWGIARRDVSSLEIVDAARPHGVLANLALAKGWDVKIFIAPVSSSALTLTAFDASDRPLAHTTLPPCC